MRLSRTSPAASIPSGEWIDIPVSASASGTFGVMTVARGRSSLSRASWASGTSRRLPEVATITGSTTIFDGLYFRSFSAITQINSAEETIPIFTASGMMSVKTLSSSWPTKSTGASWIACTPRVFCAVSAVITLIP